jgi:hypothetical protein
MSANSAVKMAMQTMKCVARFVVDEWNHSSFCDQSKGWVNYTFVTLEIGPFVQICELATLAHNTS